MRPHDPTDTFRRFIAGLSPAEIGVLCDPAGALPCLTALSAHYAFTQSLILPLVLDPQAGPPLPVTTRIARDYLATGAGVARLRDVCAFAMLRGALAVFQQERRVEFEAIDRREKRMVQAWGVGATIALTLAAIGGGDTISRVLAVWLIIGGIVASLMGARSYFAACREQVRQRLRVVDGSTTKLMAELAADGIARSNVPPRLVTLGKAGLPVPSELVDLAAIRASATPAAQPIVRPAELKQASA